MGIMVYSLLWVMQDIYHHPYELFRFLFLGLGGGSVSLNPKLLTPKP